MLKKISKIVLFTLIVLIGIGAIYQKIHASADLATYPAPGKIYNVDGLKLHLNCIGSGSPTLIMEAGLMSGSMSWLKISEALAKKTTFCAYDRPGLDWSEPLGHKADSNEITNRLHKLLAVAGITDDKILVGMSAGGIYMREYYQKYPDNITGMVLIDSSHEQQNYRLPVFKNADAFGNLMNVCSIIQPLGAIRVFSLLDSYINRLDINDMAKKQWLANLNQSHACSAIYWEIESFNELLEGISAANSLADLPLLVLTRGKEPEANEAFDISLEFATSVEQKWQILQKELVALSSNSEQFIAKKSGHVIQIEQPELVIEKISLLVDKVRALATVMEN